MTIVSTSADTGATIDGATVKAPSERVLIVEDEPAARVGLEQLVKSWGFVAESAHDGEDALEKVTSFRPAIVITEMAALGSTCRDRTRHGDRPLLCAVRT